MTPTPKWYMPAAVTALIWNLMGCAAYLIDVTLSPEDVAAMNEAQQALYAAVALAALLGWPTPADAQIPDLPTFQDLGLEYISSSGFFQLLLSGRLDLEGMHIANEWVPTPTLPDECDACHVDLARQMQNGDGTLRTHRLRVFADIFLGDHLYSLIEIRNDHGLENLRAPQRTRIEQAFVRVVSGSGTEGVQLGRFASPFGSYALRHLTTVDPFLSPPLPYDYRTVMNRWRSPIDGADFIRWKDASEEVDLPGAPPVWDVTYQWGGMAFGRVGSIDIRVAAMNSAPSSHPRAWRLSFDSFKRPSWVVGATWKLSPSLEIGTSYDRGPWLAEPQTQVAASPPGTPTGAAPEDFRDFDQELISVDVAFLRGPLMIRAETIRDRWEVPNVDGMPAGLSGTLEVQTDVAPGLFVAARGGFIDFRPFDGAGAGGSEDWDYDVFRYEGAVGYRLAQNVGVMMSGYHQVQTERDDGDTTFLGLRLWWAF